MTNLVVLGQGYVGLPMALRAAAVGISVFGLDSNLAIVKTINAAHSHVDDISDECLRVGLESGYRATADPACIADADVVVVCVPTPLGPEGGPDLSAVESAGGAIGAFVRPNTLVVLESTTYPGTTEEVFAPLVTAGGLRIGRDINIAFSPERIDPGNRVYDVRNTPKVVGGITPQCTHAARQFYSRFIDTVIEAKGAREAEMAKLLENTFRHVNIALVNEIVRFSRELDIDLWDAIDCASTKPFGYMAFRPGPGVGGHCIPVDPSYLSHRVRAKLGYSFRMVELAEEINTAAPLYVADRLLQGLNQRKQAMNGAQVLLVGITYKPNISDCRETPATPLAQRLLLMGADVRYHDPFVLEWSNVVAGKQISVSKSDNVYDAAAEADAVVLLQPHAEYDLAELASASRYLLDTRGIVCGSDSVERL